MKVPRSLLQPYSIAVFTVAITLLLKLLLDQWIGADTPFLLFFAAVMISAYYGNRRAGLLAIALAALVSNYFFLYPLYSFSLQPSNILRLGVFLIEGWAITYIIVALHAARRQAEGISLRLQESEEQFSLFMDNLPGIAFIKDIEGRHLYFNKTCKDIFNFTSDAWRGKTNDQLFPDTLAAQCNEHDQIVISSRDKLEAIEFLLHDVNIIYYLISKFPIFNNKAEPVLLGGIGVDITERIQAEKALQESEIKFKSIFNGAPIAIALLDTERRILQTNAALQKMFGYRSEEIFNLSVSEFTHPDDIAAGLELYQELISGKSDHYQREERYFRKDGELIWGRVSVSIIRNADNEPQFAISMVEDITKQKQTESALREALQRLNFHVENSPLAVVEWDSNFRVSRWSQEAENIFGWKSEEVLGKNPKDWNFVFSGDLADVKNVISELYENIENRNIVVNRNYTKDGSIIYCEWYNSALLDESGKLVSVLSLVLDVSDRKQAEVAAARASDRTSRLQAVTASLSAALTPTEVAEVIVKQALSALGASRGLITVLTDSQTELEIVGSHGYPQDVIAAWHSFPVSATVPLADAVRMKKAIWLESIDMVANKYPEIAALKSDVSMGAIAAIPLTLEKQVLGALGLGFAEPQKFSEEDCEFIIALARQCAQAIERAQLYNAEQKARAEAEASEQRFRFLAESIPQLVWTARADGWVDYFNQRWYKYTGLTAEQSLGWGWLDALHPDERQHSIEEWNKCAKNKEIYEIEKRVKGVNGTYHWQLTRAEPMLNEVGQIVKWFGTCTDIDDRKQAEESIQKNNERLKLLSETASNLLLDEQPQEFIDSVFKRLSVHLGLEIYLIYFINKDKQTLQLHDYGGISEAIAKDVEWLDLNQTVCGSVAQNQQPLLCENVQQSPDNKTAHLRSLGITAYACYPLMARDQFIGTLSFGTRNRSSFALDELELMQVVCDQVASAMERSRLISQLQQQSEDLANANRMQDEFLAVLSHELRTPLNSMLGWA
ncbi:MAG TPA: PAS domain S-box protein, partial [Candidatus Obscuribacterales bacterium]